MRAWQSFSLSPLAIGMILVGLLFLAACILLAYWHLVVAEGVYLGPRIVWLLYDWTARRYNTIKCFNASDETRFLGAPLARALMNVPTPLVLDVACGTGRLPKTLLAQPEFNGKIIGLDASRAMLSQAARELGNRVTLIWQTAERLPFGADTFDAVTCLEALEFMPNLRQALTEITRVLRPGGILLISNRIGPWARWMPGHTMSTAELGCLLNELGLEYRSHAWQVEYDLVWAIRRGHSAGGGARPLPAILLCPHCRQPLERIQTAWRCEVCGRTFPVAADGIIEMMNRSATARLCLPWQTIANR